MIYWLREKFEACIPILVILNIVISGIAVGIFFAMKSGFVGFLVGAAIGCILSLIFCIVFYGFTATVICIANSTEENTELLERTTSLLTEIKSCADTVKNKLDALDEISSKLDSVDADEKSSASPSENKTETFDIVRINGKKFAVKDDATGKFFCPNCHASVITTDLYCNNCNTRLAAD